MCRVSCTRRSIAIRCATSLNGSARPEALWESGSSLQVERQLRQIGRAPLARRPEPKASPERDHRGVLAQRRTEQADHAGLPREFDQACQQRNAKTMSLPRVAEHDRDLGLALAGLRRVTRDA